MESQEPRIDNRTRSDNKIGIVGAKKKLEADKATPVLTYVKGHEIESVGGPNKAREIAKKAIESAAKKGKKK